VTNIIIIFHTVVSDFAEIGLFFGKYNEAKPAIVVKIPPKYNGAR
jgi:hypothetical protein